MHVVATAGHVDHGKSTLLRAITGQEPDRWAEEQRRGLTIDLGFVWADLPSGGSIAFVDVPGHHKFVDNALAGAGAVEDVLLVVAADDGWSAQTQEHVEIIDLLGLRGTLVAITKTAVVEPSRVEEVVADVTRRLAGTVLADAPIVTVDALSGVGVDELVTVLDARLATTTPTPLAGARMWIDRSFSVRGTGTVVTGTLAGGPINVGDEVRLVPQDRLVRIRGIQSLGDADKQATGPARVALALSDVGVDEVGRGDAIVTPPGRWLTSATVDVLATSLPGRALERTGDWIVHIGSARLPATLLQIGGAVKAPKGDRAARATGPMRIALSRPVPLLVGDRLVIRETGRQATMGGAVVLDPDPQGALPRGQRRQRHVVRLMSIADGDDPVSGLVQGGARATSRVNAALRTPSSTAALTLGDATLDPAVAVAVTERILAAASSVTPVDALVKVATRPLPAPAAKALVRSLVSDGRLTTTPDGLVAADAAPEVADKAMTRTGLLLERLNEAALSPPKLAEVAAETGVTRVEVQQLTQKGQIVRSGDHAFHADQYERAIQIIRDLAAAGPFTAADARTAWDTTRKTAIPLLELLDARGITNFNGSTRTLR